MLDEKLLLIGLGVIGLFFLWKEQKKGNEEKESGGSKKSKKSKEIVAVNQTEQQKVNANSRSEAPKDTSPPIANVPAQPPTPPEDPQKIPGVLFEEDREYEKKTKSQKKLDNIKRVHSDKSEK